MGGILCLERDIFIGFILQAIESYWISTKNSFLNIMKGCSGRILLHSYLQEFIFRDRFGDNAFNNLCYH